MEEWLWWNVSSVKLSDEYGYQTSTVSILDKRVD